jgi:hypothetical protein
LNVPNEVITNLTSTNNLLTNSTIINLTSTNAIITNLTTNGTIINSTLTVTSNSIPLIKCHGLGNGSSIICDDSSNANNQIRCIGDPNQGGGRLFATNLFKASSYSTVFTINSTLGYNFKYTDLCYPFINRSNASSGQTDYLCSPNQFSSSSLVIPCVFTTLLHNISSNAITYRTGSGGGLANIYGNYAGNAFLNGSTGFVLDPGRYVQLTFNVFDTLGDFDLFIVG